MKVNRNRYIILSVFIITFCVFAKAQTNSLKAMFDEHFLAGKIVSISDKIACYRVASNSQSSKYGYCIIDNEYTPKFNNISTSWTSNKGETKKEINSKCYTIIPPCFDYAMTFSEGWAPVCKEKKWSYISKDGQYLCDFIFDSAYPFANGKAKVRYLGSEYQIDTNGNGLPQTGGSNLDSLYLDTKSLLINQLLEEGQYEKAIEFGNDILTYWLNRQELCDLQTWCVIPLIRIMFAASGAQNSLMSMFVNRNPSLFDYYRNLSVIQEFSYSVNSPVLQIENFKKCEYDQAYLSLPNIIQSVNRYDFKQSVVLLEKLIRQSNDTDNPFRDILHHDLLELAGDIEGANAKTISLSQINSSIDDTFSRAVFLAKLRQFQSASVLFERIINEKQNETFLVALCYHNLALIELASNLDSEAIGHLNKAISLYDRVSKTDLKLEACSTILQVQSKLSKADYLKLLNNYVKEEIEYDLNLFTFEDSYTLGKTWGYSLYRINQIITDIVTRGIPESYNAGYELTVFLKSVYQNAQTTWLQHARESKNNEIAKLYNSYVKLRNDQNGIDIYELDNDSLYLELTSMFKIERSIKQKLYGSKLVTSPEYYMSYSSVSNSLCNDELAIEFFNYRNDRKSKIYGAWIIEPQSKYPKYQEIVSEDLCSTYTTDFRYNKNFDNIRKLYTSTFSNHIWGNVSDIKNYNVIYFSPSDVLSEVGIEYLNYSDQPIYLGRKIHRLTSTLSLPSLKNVDKFNVTSASLFGGLDYGTSLLASSRGASHSGYLKYSKLEVDNISKIMLNLCEPRLFSGKQGTKAKFWDFIESPSIIHVATHGWQKEHPFSLSSFMNRDRFNYYNQNKELEDEDWLLHTSGLCMSQGDNFTDSLSNILLASEVAQHVLSNTSLVVLSACNTIAGSTSNGYSCTLGLNYALQRAKVKNVVSSLWNVDDAKTFEFMNIFYYLLVEKKNVYTAFNMSIEQMKLKYPNNPEIWASFVLTENY